MRFLPISLVLLAASSSFAGEPQRILFDRLAPQEIVLYVAKTDGSDEKPLLSVAGGMDYNPAYSADGKWVVFTSERNGSADLYRVKSDGSGLERLTEDPAFDDQAAFSSDGRQIVFVSSRDGGHANLWILDVETRKVKRLTNGLWGDFRPTWSPDGKWIAFSSDRHTPVVPAAGRWEQLHLTDIYLISPEGAGLRRLTYPGGFCGSPKWSQDSRRLAAYCMSGQDSFDNRFERATGKSRLVSMDLATGAQTEIVSGLGALMSPAFVGHDIGYVRKSADNPGIFYTSGKTGPRGRLRAPSWSPDGEHVVY